MSNIKKPANQVNSNKAVTKESASPAPTQSAVSPAPLGAGTLEPTMKDRIRAAFSMVDSKEPMLKWWELVHLCGDKAKGEQRIPIHEKFSNNVVVWYGVSQSFRDAILDMLRDKRIRFIQASPMGYFPAAEMPPLPIARDWRIVYPNPTLFLTCVELVP